MIWRIDVNDEWTHDETLASTAIEAGWGAYEFDEDDLARMIDRLEERLARQHQLFHELQQQIHQRVVDGVNSNPHTKNAHFNLIEHDLREFVLEANEI